MMDEEKRALNEGEGMTHEEFLRSRSLRLRKVKGVTTKVKLGLSAKKHYCRTLRRSKGAKAKYRLTERFGDVEERREKNRRYPYVSLTDWRTGRELLLPDGKTRGQAWGVIRHLWLKIRICKNKGYPGLEDACRNLRKEQDNLGIKLTEFPDFNLFGQYLSQEEREYFREQEQNPEPELGPEQENAY